jgi:hypothetical protein
MGARKNILSRWSQWLGGGTRKDSGDRVRLVGLQAANERLTAELRELNRHVDLIERRHEAELAGLGAASTPGAGPAIRVEVSIGELVDKKTILEIKLERVTDVVKRRNIAAECDVITAAAAHLVEGNPQLEEMTVALKAVNAEIWDAEDQIRAYEQTRKFDESFIALARSIHAANDRRAALKRRINESMGSRLLEEKSYPI